MAQAHSLNAYMMRHLRQILGVKWWHRIPNQDILMKTNMSSMYETLIHRNLRWTGHLMSSSGSTTLGCQIKSFTPSSRKDIQALAGQNSVSKIPSKENWHGKGFRQGSGTKKLTTDHSGENLYEGSRHRIRWTASSSNAQMNTLVDQDIVKQSYLSVKIILGNLVNGKYWILFTNNRKPGLTKVRLDIPRLSQKCLRPIPFSGVPL